jgi:hypothetical protein
VPALPERREDIPLLVGHFLAKAARKLGESFEGVAPAFLERATSYDRARREGLPAGGPEDRASLKASGGTSATTPLHRGLAAGARRAGNLRVWLRPPGRRQPEHVLEV